MLATLFVAAAVWRLAYLHRLSLTPLAGSLTEDSVVYWTWSGGILARPIGTAPFFLGPLYPYLLAALRLLGASIPHVLAIQALWGAGAVVLLADAARRLTRPAIGVAVGIAMAGYEMAVMFDGLILMESLLFFLEALLLWWIVSRDWTRAGPRTYAATGALLGLLAEGRATAAALLVVAALVLVGWRRLATRRALAHAAALVLGFALLTLPVAARNLALSGEWIPFAYNLGVNLYVGNNPEATGSFGLVGGTHLIRDRATAPSQADAGLDGRDYLRKVEGVDLGPEASSRYWARKAVDYAAANPGRTARLTLRKLGMMWNRREYAQIENVEEFRALAGPIGLPWVGRFALLGALGLAGLWYARRGGAAGGFLVGYAAVMTFAVVPFFVTDRYRFPLVPAAALLAALLVAEGWRALRGGAWRTRLRLAAALAFGAVVVNLPMPSLGSARIERGIAFDLATRWLERRRPDLALKELDQALALERRGAAPSSASASAATDRASLYYVYGVSLVQSGRPAEALPWYEKAVAFAPENAVMVRALADAYRDAGRASASDSLLARLPELVGGESLALTSRGWGAARAGRFAAAESSFAAAVARDPGLLEAWTALVRVRVQLGRSDAARAALEAARAEGLDDDAYHAHRALVFATSGAPDSARHALELVSPRAIAVDPALAEAVRVARGLLRAP